VRIVLRLLVLLILATTPVLAAAHGVGIQASLRGDRVRIEGYFDDDTPTQAANVNITTLDDATTIAEGVTDETGVWSLPCPPPGRYRVVLDAGGGHLAKTTFTVPEHAVEGTISEGLDREWQTGGRRWLAIAVGLTFIGLFTLFAQRLARKGTSK
jgi:hypothetical protein